jgi:hypothetical protein
MMNWVVRPINSEVFLRNMLCFCREIKYSNIAIFVTSKTVEKSSCNRTSLRVSGYAMYVYNAHHLFFSRNSVTVPRHHLTICAAHCLYGMLLQYITVHLCLHQNRKNYDVIKNRTTIVVQL